MASNKQKLQIKTLANFAFCMLFSLGYTPSFHLDMVSSTLANPLNYFKSGT